MTLIYVSKLTITGSDNGLSRGRRQAIIWTNAGILLIGPLGNLNRTSIIIIQENAVENVCQNDGHFVHGGDELRYIKCCWSIQK